MFSYLALETVDGEKLFEGRFLTSLTDAVRYVAVPDRAHMAKI